MYIIANGILYPGYVIWYIIANAIMFCMNFIFARFASADGITKKKKIAIIKLVEGGSW